MKKPSKAFIKEFMYWYNKFTDKVDPCSTAYINITGYFDDFIGFVSSGKMPWEEDKKEEINDNI